MESKSAKCFFPKPLNCFTANTEGVVQLCETVCFVTGGNRNSVCLIQLLLPNQINDYYYK